MISLAESGGAYSQSLSGLLFVSPIPLPIGSFYSRSFCMAQPLLTRTLAYFCGPHIQWLTDLGQQGVGTGYGRIGYISGSL